MTVHKFKDIIEKESDGELICGSIDNRSRDNQNVIVRRPKFFNFVPILNSKDGIISWNCSYAAKILRECQDKNHSENITEGGFAIDIKSKTRYLIFCNYHNFVL